MKNKYVCIHGHFYQPPRENPWIDEVETEDSAFPYHDWNERILHECYGPNVASPILEKENVIGELFNNYEHISFNVGPTLMSWIERRHPSLYAEIILSDRRSAQRSGGHGNAIAQAYNHLIMPLAGRRDKVTQVRWGLYDFRYRFRRESEGMWLPETAVDEETLEVLLSEGVKFTILSPAQAAQIRPIGAGPDDWKQVDSGSLNTMRPYRWFSRETPGRHIDLFFYHGKLSHGVAFERLLSSGEDFAKRIFSAFSTDETVELASLATDGETFGHHHKFGNMGLSYALKKLPEDTPVRLTNFGEFLSLYPPTEEVEIRSKTAWSCSHGVRRWQDDCGCNSGSHPGWNQKWRKPLREALDWLAAEIDAVYLRRAAKLLADPWVCRDAYIMRLLDGTAQNTLHFLRQAAIDRLLPEDAHDILRLCEMQRNRMLMFTSCGWFFDDPSGIETTQIMKYAARAIELTQDDSARLEAGFLDRLSSSKSNDPEVANAANVYSRAAAPLRVTLERAAAHFAICEYLQENPRPPSAITLKATLKNNVFGTTTQSNFELKRHRIERFSKDAADREAYCSLMHFDTRHLPTLEKTGAIAAVFRNGPRDIECWLRTNPRTTDFDQALATIPQLFDSADPEPLRKALADFFSPTPFGLDALFSDYRRMALTYLAAHGSRESQDALRAWRVEIRRHQVNHGEDPGHLLALILENKRAGANPDSLPHIDALRDRLIYSFKALCVKPTKQRVQESLDLLSAVMQLGLRIDFWELKWLYAQFANKPPNVLPPELRSDQSNRSLAQLLQFPVPESNSSSAVRGLP